MVKEQKYTLNGINTSGKEKLKQIKIKNKKE
jgi:hypothetical protein